MKAKKSPLKFIDFAVFSSHFETIMPGEKQQCDYNKLNLDIDFEIFINTEKKSLYNLALNINCNTLKKTKPGYKYSIIANGIFELSDYEELDKPKKDQYIYYSALPMLISSVRNYLLNVSSYAPLGKYLLPAIDLTALVKQKIESNKQAKEIEEEKSK